MLQRKINARVGIYSGGLKAYWDQFQGLKERLITYGIHIENKISADAQVFNYGLADDEISASKAREWFNEKNVDSETCCSCDVKGIPYV